MHMLRNPVMLFMVLAIVFTGLGGICTSIAALFHHPPMPTAGETSSPVRRVDPEPLR